MPDALAGLTRINLDDLVSAFGWHGKPLLDRAARLIFAAPARRFARHMLDFDQSIAGLDLRAAAALAECHYASSVRAYGRECVPEGPVLFVANHPGMTDTLALLASIDRPDLRVVALNRPFLLSLPNLSQQLVFVTEMDVERLALVRSLGRHLRQGGSVLTFPAGRNEPDPNYFQDATDSLGAWTDSASAFARLVPDLAIVPVCVRGVLWRRTMDLGLVRRRRGRDEQLLLGSALQLLANVAMGIKPVKIDVQFGSVVRSAVAANTHEAIIGEMRRLVMTPPRGVGKELL